MFSTKRNEMRDIFFQTWRKHLEKQLLEPLENQILEVILLHPEYHDLLSHPEDYQDKDFVENNPFLHLGLHIALREQITTDRPAGIVHIYKKLLEKIHDPNACEHRMMECLEQIIYEANHSGQLPIDSVYLDLLRSRVWR